MDAAPRPSLGLGDLLMGRYRLDAELFCNLPDARRFLATDKILGRKAEVNLIGGPHTEDAIDAARRAALIDDPRLVRIIDAGSYSGLSFVLTAPLEGVSLADVGPLSATQARAVAGEVASALAEAAARDVYHLALRPELLFLGSGDSLKIGGLAWDAASRGQGKLDAAAANAFDAQELVAVLYAALTARWPGKTASVMGSPPLWDGRPVAPIELVSGVPGELNTLCSVTLAGAGAGPTSAAQAAQLLGSWPKIAITLRHSATVRGPIPRALTPPRPLVDDQANDAGDDAGSDAGSSDAPSLQAAASEGRSVPQWPPGGQPLGPTDADVATLAAGSAIQERLAQIEAVLEPTDSVSEEPVDAGGAVGSAPVGSASVAPAQVVAPWLPEVPDFELPPLPPELVALLEEDDVESPPGAPTQFPAQLDGSETGEPPPAAASPRDTATAASLAPSYLALYGGAGADDPQEAGPEEDSWGDSAADQPDADGYSYAEQSGDGPPSVAEADGQKLSSQRRLTGVFDQADGQFDGSLDRQSSREGDSQSDNQPVDLPAAAVRLAGSEDADGSLARSSLPELALLAQDAAAARSGAVAPVVPVRRSILDGSAASRVELSAEDSQPFVHGPLPDPDDLAAALAAATGAGGAAAAPTDGSAKPAAGAAAPAEPAQAGTPAAARLSLERPVFGVKTSSATGEVTEVLRPYPRVAPPMNPGVLATPVPRDGLTPPPQSLLSPAAGVPKPPQSLLSPAAGVPGAPGASSLPSPSSPVSGVPGAPVGSPLPGVSEGTEDLGNLARYLDDSAPDSGPPPDGGVVSPLALASLGQQESSQPTFDVATPAFDQVLSESSSPEQPSSRWLTALVFLLVVLVCVALALVIMNQAGVFSLDLIPGPAEVTVPAGSV
jgi:hypothetical protein